MTRDIATCRHRDGDRAQQHADQARETQEAASSVHGAFDLRTGIRYVPQALAALLVSAQPALEELDPLARAGEQLPVTDPGCQVG